MAEAANLALEIAESRYHPTAREVEMETCKLSKPQKIKGSPRIWYVDLEEGAGIFKPKCFREKVISDSQNERAAYLISQIVGLNFVPTTVLRLVNGQEGALQEIIEDAEFSFEVDSTPLVENGLYKYWIFGHIIRNMDRHEYNLLIKDGQVWSIDHEASFDSDYLDPRNFDTYRQFYGKKAPKELIEPFEEFSKDEIRREILRAELEHLIGVADADITLRRTMGIGQLLVAKGQIDSWEELAIK